jgi:glycosyltransferase involved in cell wall biosynthesis/predicted SAM-dependent methyltransferase
MAGFDKKGRVMQMDGLVSIGVPLFNGAAHVADMLSCLISQTYQNIEIIIADNASTDDSFLICDKFCAADSRIRIFKNPTNIGPVANFNRVFKEARGHYFMWASFDDLFDPDYVKACVETLESDQSLSLVGTLTAQFETTKDKILFVDHGFSLLQDSPLARFRTYKQVLLLPHHIGMIFYGVYRREILENVMPLKPIIGTDHILVSAVALRGKVRTISRLLAWKRAAGISRSMESIARSLGRTTPPRLPYADREWEFQKLLMSTKAALFNKIYTSVWSLLHLFFYRTLLRGHLGNVLRTLSGLSLRDLLRIIRYRWTGRRPWSRGYYNYKLFFLKDAVSSPYLLKMFINHEELPERYGHRLDERAVEYLWVFSRLADHHRCILDAGSALNFPLLLESPTLMDRNIVLCTLAPENNIYKSARISYVYNDLRTLMFQDAYFDAIVCVSTLEHIGLNNTMLYTDDVSFCEANHAGYIDAIREMHRVLKLGGKLLITVPFGKKLDLGWLQQFDQDMVGTIIETFDGKHSHVDFFRYENDGWQWSNPETCKSDEYFDIHSGNPFTDDMRAAAKAVACIELIK